MGTFGRLAGMLALVLVLAGCGTGGTGGADAGADVAPDIAADAADAADGPAEAADPGAGPDAADPSTPGDGPGDVPDDTAETDVRCPGGFVYIDFPCETKFRCEGPAKYRTRHSYGCAEAGYDPACCSGGACAESEPIDCPAGTLCVETGGWYSANEEACLPLDCGRTDDLPCPADRFCARPASQCDSPGVCVRGQCIEDVGQPDFWLFSPPYERWECGCDGVTYHEDCSRQAARTSLDHLEACCDPSRLDLQQGHLDDFTNWVACVARDWAGPFPPDVQKMIQYLPRYPLAEALGCRADEVGFTGDTYVHVDDPPDKWLALCRLATTAGVRTVFGTRGAPANCDGAPCFTGRSCRENSCPTPCGCCPCTEGERICGDNRVLQHGDLGIETCQGGCFGDPEWCGVAGQACVLGAHGPACADTCGQIAAAWEGLQWTRNCKVQGDCHVLDGRCALGLGGCWFAFAPDEFTSLADVDDLAARWTALGCGTPRDCECAPPPQATCQGGTCVLSGS